MTIQDARAGKTIFMRNIGCDTQVDVTSVDANGVPAEWVAAPNANDNSAVLFLHGGAYILGLSNPIENWRPESQNRLAAGFSTSSIDLRLKTRSLLPSRTQTTPTDGCWTRESTRHRSPLPEPRQAEV